LTWLAIVWGAAMSGCLYCVLWAATRLRIVTVDGPSMAPTLHDGDRVLVRRVRASALRRDDLAIAVLVSPARRWVVKRVAALPGDPAPAGVSVSAGLDGRVPDGMLALLGDNPDESVDSRDFGYVPVERIVGRVVRRLGPATTP
jgi:signal peptidase I